MGRRTEKQQMMREYNAFLEEGSKIEKLEEEYGEERWEDYLENGDDPDDYDDYDDCYDYDVYYAEEYLKDIENGRLR